MLLLAHVATTRPEQEIDAGAVAEALTQLGWRVEGRRCLPTGLIFDLPAHVLLSNISPEPRDAWRNEFSAAAAAMARAALRAQTGRPPTR